MVLLVVDTQKLITTPDLYNFNAFEDAVKTLIAAARENNVEVIYVRHDDGVDAELTKGTLEWYFKCDYEGNVDGFDGVTIAEFDANMKICDLKEFQSKAEHYCPYGE